MKDFDTWLDDRADRYMRERNCIAEDAALYTKRAAYSIQALEDLLRHAVNSGQISLPD